MEPFRQASELHDLCMKIADDANADIDEYEREEESHRNRMFRATSGLKAGLGIVKQGAEQQKVSLANALKAAKAEAGGKRVSEKCSARKVSLADSTKKLASSRVDSVAADMQKNPGKFSSSLVAVGKQFDEEVARCRVCCDNALQVRSQVMERWEALDWAQLDVAERSLKSILLIVKETGTPEQKQSLAEVIKAVPKSTEDASAADKLVAWRKTVRLASSCPKPNPLPVLDAYDAATNAQRSSSTKDLRASKPAVDNVADDDGEAGDSTFVENVEFAEAFDAGPSSESSSSMQQHDSNICKKCKSDFFSAEELQLHLKRGCNPAPPPPKLVVVEEDDNSDEVPSGQGKSILGSAKNNLKRFSAMASPATPKKKESIPEVAPADVEIGAPTNFTHSATADTGGHVTLLGAGGSTASPAVQRAPGTPSGRRAVPLPPGVVAVGSPASPSTPGLSRNTGSTQQKATSLFATGGSEPVLEFQKIRVQLSDGLCSRIKSNRAKVRLILKAGNHRRATAVATVDVPGVADFSDQIIYLPNEFQGLPFSVVLNAKPMSESKTGRASSASKMDAFANKINSVGVPESTVGISKDTPLGSVKSTPISIFSVKTGENAPGAGAAEVGVLTFTVNSVDREPLALSARRIIAPRVLPDESDALKTLESCKLLTTKIKDVKAWVDPAAPAPGRYKANDQKDAGDVVRKAMNAWPPRIADVSKQVKTGYRVEESFKNWTGQTLYHFAVMSGDPACVRIVQRMGTEPDPEEPSFDPNDNFVVKKPKKPIFRAGDKDETGVSAWILSVILGNTDCIRAIAEFDPDIVGHTLYSLSALHVACFMGNLPIVRLLIDELQMPVDLKDQNSATPLFYAAYSGHAELVEYLCSKQAFVDVEDSQSQSPIMMALDAGHGHIARILLRHKADIRSFNLRGDNAIWLCIARNIPDLLTEFILGGSCDLGAALERYRNSLLHKLIMFINDEQMGCMMIAALLSHGAKVDMVNAEKKTPLFYAAALSRPKIVTLLLNSGANAKAVDAFENSPLHFAFLPSIAEALVEKGAKVNQQNSHGLAPLHVMCAFGFLDTVSCLRALGAKDNLRNRNGNVPMDLFQLIPPKDWLIFVPFFAEDENATATGGIVIHEKVRADSAAQMSGAKNKARNSFRQIASKVKKGAKALNDAMTTDQNE